MTPHGNSTNALQLTRSSACRRVGCCSCPARSGAAGYTDDGGIRRCDRSTCRSVCGSGRVHRMPKRAGRRGGPDVREQSPVAREVSEPGSYGFLDLITTEDGSGIRGGIGGGPGHQSHAVVYVGAPDVEAALQRADSLGGERVKGPARSPTGLVVGHFTDLEGTLMGVAGTA